MDGRQDRTHVEKTTELPKKRSAKKPSVRWSGFSTTPAFSSLARKAIAAIAAVCNPVSHDAQSFTRSRANVAASYVAVRSECKPAANPNANQTTENAPIATIALISKLIFQNARSMRLTVNVSHERQPPQAHGCTLTGTAASRWLHALVRLCAHPQHHLIGRSITTESLSPTSRS